jgi:hypothetical protein
LAPAGEEVAVAGVLVDELGDVPARGDDRLAAPSHVVERRLYQLGAEAAAPQVGLDLGVRKHKSAPFVAIVRDAHEPSVERQLVPASVRVVTHLGRHAVTLPGLVADAAERDRDVAEHH